MFGRIRLLLKDKHFWSRAALSLFQAVTTALALSLVWSLFSSQLLESVNSNDQVKNVRGHLSTTGIQYLIYFVDSCIIYTCTVVIGIASLAFTNYGEAMSIVTVSRYLFVRYLFYTGLFALTSLAAAMVVGKNVGSGMPLSILVMWLVTFPLIFGYKAYQKMYVLYGTMNNSNREAYFATRSMLTPATRFLKRGPETTRFYVFPVMLMLIVSLSSAIVVRQEGHQVRFVPIAFLVSLSICLFLCSLTRRAWDIVKPGERERLWIHTDPYRVLPESRIDLIPTNHSIDETDRTYPDQSTYNHGLRMRLKAERAEARRLEAESVGK